MSAKALRTQLLGAIAMVLVATLALGSSTFAWFSINSTVEATGMTFTTKVSDNLFITKQEVTEGSTDILADADFGTTLVSTKTALLEPVSTIDGINYFYASVSNVKGDGDTVLDKWIAYNPADPTDFADNYQADGAKGYIDYYYNLKAVNGGDTAVPLKLTDIDLNSNVAGDPQKAFRVAVFVNKATGSGDNTTEGKYTVTGAVATKYTDTDDNDVTKPSIFTVPSAENFTATKAVTSTSALADVTYNNAVSVKVAAHSTEFYKVVVRVWLEGEDKTCNNTTFADLNKGTWALSTTWKLGDGIAATNINSADKAAPVSLAEYTVSTTAGEWLTINGVVYKPITKTGGVEDLYVAVVNTKYRVYLITDDLHPTDMTNMYTGIPNVT